MDYFKTEKCAGLDLSQLESAFKAGVKVFLFSNPNNPTGVIYSPYEIRDIANLAAAVWGNSYRRRTVRASDL